jgi:hypothetical protein
MINKKNVLGKAPEELGDKDAIHVAIVAVRAANVISPGERVGLNEHREAVSNPKGVGVADPFRKGNITRGQHFWLLLDQDAVPNVRHVWEHPRVDFTPPAREVVRNTTLLDAAKELGVTYEQLLEACEYAVEHDRPAKYPGTFSADELDNAQDHIELWEVWSEWGSETGHYFPNEGSACCPEYAYPDCSLFSIP